MADPATAALDKNTVEGQDADIFNKQMLQATMFNIWTLVCCLPVQLSLWQQLFGKCRVKNSSAIFSKWLHIFFVVQSVCLTWALSDFVYQQIPNLPTVPEFPIYYTAIMLVTLGIVCGITQDPKTVAQHTGMSLIAALPALAVMNKVAFIGNFIEVSDITRPITFFLTMLAVFWDDVIGNARTCQGRLLAKNSHSRFERNAPRAVQAAPPRGSDSRSTVASCESRTTRPRSSPNIRSDSYTRTKRGSRSPRTSPGRSRLRDVDSNLSHSSSRNDEGCP